ncbi:cytochrome b-c1 complex subunit 2, mitochondrial [Anthonomus grandis grandis]|uniref:cytochrome b-c1 complex subunit 2, mitochondrial n=1 Tax=Anthonomus grandis grandis TaxID=2921223 RepID=UPI0021653F4B|nr:cytochrome b-c1 complex subunit 2, mitochondrial [Anthonomus grandis grandis]
MATNIAKKSLFRAIGTRGYAQLAPVSGTTNYDLKINTLPNKLVVVSAENESPIARVSIIFRAGARNETNDNLGASHVIRVAAGLSTRNCSQFAITRNIQQLGANLTATSDRETISYTLEGTRNAVEAALPFLTEVATQQVFKPWEVAELASRLRLELAIRPLQLRAVDLLHKAAFRTGLGNSLFVPKFQIGKMSSETLQHYVTSNFTSGRGAVVGLGLEPSKVQHLAQTLSLDTSDGINNTSPYKGGEIRSDKGGDFAFVAIAGEGASIKNTKEALAVSVLQKVLGGGPKIKWSALDNGLLNRSIAGSTIEGFASQGINANYSDTGLVGVLLAAPARSAGKLVEGAVKVLKGGNVTDADVSRGKNQLKAELLLEMESGRKAAQVIGNQAVLTGAALSPCELSACVDSVSTSDVRAALQKAGKKLTIASVGNLSNVPYADELK